MENALTEKLFGMPAWVWGGIVGIGIAGFSYLHHKGTSGDATDSGGTDSTTAADNGMTDGVADASTADAGGDYPYSDMPEAQDYGGDPGGFNYSSPPPAVPVTAHLSVAQENQIKQILKQEKAENRKLANLNRKRGHSKASPVHKSPPERGKPVKRK
jgi:hypothetical protein